MLLPPTARYSHLKLICCDDKYPSSIGLVVTDRKLKRNVLVIRLGLDVFINFHGLQHETKHRVDMKLNETELP